MENPLNFDSPEYNSAAKQPGRRAFLKAAGISFLSAGLGGWLVACDSLVNPQSAVTSAPSQGSGVPSAMASELKGAITPGVTAASSSNPPKASIPPTAIPTEAAKPTDTAQAYLKAWEDKRYNFMYSLLNSSSKSNITEDKFVGRYNDISNEATINAVETKIDSVAPPPGPGAVGYQIPFDVTVKTGRVGDIKQRNTMLLRPEDGKWLVDWSPTLIFQQLNPGTLVHLQDDSPPRGEIKDAAGQGLAEPRNIPVVFVVRGKIENEDQLLTVLSQNLNLDKQKIKSLYSSGQPDWRMDIKELPADTPQATIDKLLEVKGVGVDDKTIRAYPTGQDAGNITGYVSSITVDDLKTLAAKGYGPDDKIGRSGVEAWAEEILAGSKGGKLQIIKQDGSPVTTLAERSAQASSNVILNLDMRFQRLAESALNNRNGSVVVMNVNDGAVIALASVPSFDPNVFVKGLTDQQYKALADDPRKPFQNRPVNGTYPTGSIFKVITASAALERAGFNFDSSFTCTGHWTGLGNSFAKDCWLKTGHGKISLYEGIVQSCDVVFYELGKKLDEIDKNLLPGFTKACGLGSSTEIVGISDYAGVVPDDAWKQKTLQQAWFRGDAVNLAIGQGYLLATPLQMAGVYAAFANGGNVPIPRLIGRTEKNGAATPIAPKARLQLPVSQPNIARIRQAMVDVVQSPRGTAYQEFIGSKIKVAGKTGTAESGKDNPHAWFACYAPADKPKYVVVVMLEQLGEGSTFAAPVARKVLEALPY